MPGAKDKSGGKRDGAGRKAFAPTEDMRDQVRNLAAFGLRHEDIILFVKDKQGKPITTKTLLKYFDYELDKGKLIANVTVAKTLFKKAQSGDNTCMIFWLKTQAGWKESPQRLEHTGAIEVKKTHDLSQLSDDELKELAALSVKLTHNHTN
jgi:hypothetical protein